MKLSMKKSNVLNIKEFSSLAGVSTATVSRVFAGKKTVTEATRSHVLSLAEQFGFRPNQVAQSSFGGKTKSVGVILCRLTNSYFADIAVGIQRELLKADYLPIVIDLREDGERAGLRRLIDHRVDGIILSIADQTLGEDEIREITRFSLPVVTVDGTGYDMSYDNVSSDDRNSGRIAGEYLTRCGHRHIGYVFSAHERSHTALSRLDGLREALAESGVVIKQSDIINLPVADRPDDMTLIEHLRGYLTAPERPSAIYAFNDYDAVLVYRAAVAAGLRIPDDLSVIGNGGLDFSSVMFPPLSSIRQDGMEIGRQAAVMMLARLDNYCGSPRKIVQTVELIERGSVRNID